MDRKVELAPSLKVSEDDHVVTITLNRPERLNALNDALVESLANTLAAIPSDARVVVLRGAGRAFSSGHDLKAASEKGSGTRLSARRAAEDLQQITRLMRACHAPIVGAIHGYAVGAGAEIALSCDIIVAARSTQFQFPETSIGLVVTNGFTSILPRTVGPARAKEILLMAERFSADQALAWGLVNRVCPDGELDTVTAQVVQRIKQNAPIALRIAKRLVDEGLERDIDLTMSREVQATIEAEMTQDAQEATAAFIDRRQPKFVGR